MIIIKSTFIFFISFFLYLVINRLALFLPNYLIQQSTIIYNRKNYFFMLLTFYVTTITFIQQHSLLITMCILYFNAILLCLSEIDWYYGLLPDELTLVLMWCGLLLNINHVFTDSTSSILGAVTGYGSLWLFNQLFFLCTKQDGIGYGDFKLFAAIGAWLGWQFLAIIITFASFLALIFSLFLSIRDQKLYRILPFGPFIAFSAMIVMLNSYYIYRWNLFS